MKDHFTDKEMSCPCCGLDKTKPEDRKKLNLSRVMSDFPYNVNSGCRCKKHNKEVDGTDNSDHIYATGWDIEYYNPTQLSAIIHNSRFAGFTRFFIYKNFIHIGLPREGKKNNILEVVIGGKYGF